MTDDDAAWTLALDVDGLDDDVEGVLDWLSSSSSCSLVSNSLLLSLTFDRGIFFSRKHEINKLPSNRLLLTCHMFDIEYLSQLVAD